MAHFTDIYIRRPVLAATISLMIFVVGLNALFNLPVQQYPRMHNTVVTVRTPYPGASPRIVESFITSPIEKLVASADGVDFVTSESTEGVSLITAYIKLNHDPDNAFASVSSQAAQARGRLPREAQPSILEKSTGSQIDLMYIGFNSPRMTSPQITDYISRVVQPQIQTIPGVAQVKILGSTLFAMRIWLNSQRMAALNVTPNDINAALQNNNFISAPGSTKGVLVAYSIDAQTNLHRPEEFEKIVVRNRGTALVHLRDVSTVELGPQNLNTRVTFNGKSAVFISVSATPTANPLTVIAEIKRLLPGLRAQFPPSLTANVVYDITEYIRASMHEVVETILEAALIVILVIFLFLGSFRAVLIPVVTIPLSLVGVCMMMLAFGFSINLLTLLAMVLAIGLVVDDAIVVVENIQRHIEEGMTPFDASIIGTREIAIPVISMTITLAAVYAPIGFMGGITGALFREFAFTLAGAVIISGVIALTLSPMMCSKLLPRETQHYRIANYINTRFDQLKHYYQGKLHYTLDQRESIFLVGLVILVSIFFLYTFTQSELAPVEDQSALFVSATAPAYANIDYSKRFSEPMNDIFKSFSPENFFIINGIDKANSNFGGMVLKPWNQRKETQKEIGPQLQQKLNSLSGLQAVAFPLPALPVSGFTLPIQFVITTSKSYEHLYLTSQIILEEAQKSGLFIFLNNSLRIDNPQLNVVIDADKAGVLGLSRASIGSALSNALGGNYVNYFDTYGQSYQVIPQLQRRFRLNPSDIGQIYIRTESNKMIPLSTITHIEQVVEPNRLTHFQQLHSSIIEGVMVPNKTIGQGLTYLQDLAKKVLPPEYKIDYAGQSRQYIEEGTALVYTFFFAIIIIFLVLAAQFESFRDPLIILVTVPMSICGALIFLNIGLATINIYTQIGLITLVGLISKHGILMVDFANHLKANENLSSREAIEKAAAIRLRPILMTTAAMVLGLIPLLFASGAGALSRFAIGLVIVTGILIGTFFTLFILPAVYIFVKGKERQTVT